MTADSLTVHYSIQNHGNAVYLWDNRVLIDANGGITVGSTKPKVVYSAPNLITLADKLFPLVPGVLNAVPPHAYAEMLNAGAAKSGQVVLSLPLRDSSVKDSQRSHEVTCNRLRFVIGAISNDKQLHAQQQVVAGVTIWRPGPASWKLQHELQAEAEVSPGVKVLIKRLILR